jgi:hypothetical protein
MPEGTVREASRAVAPVQGKLFWSELIYDRRAADITPGMRAIARRCLFIALGATLWVVRPR